MNFSIRRTGRAALAAAAAAAAAVVPAARAHAADLPVLQLTARAPVALHVPPDPDDQISWGLDTQGHTVHDLHVTVDITGISGFATSSDDSCSAGLCTWDESEVGGNGTGGVLDLQAKKGAALGATGTAVITGTAADATLKSYTVQVTVGSVDLVVGGAPAEVDDAKPGSTISAPLTVADTGSLTSGSTDYTFAISPGLSFAQHFTNCDYGTGVVTDSAPQAVQTATCHFTAPVEPGKKYTLSTPLKLKVKTSALFEFLDYEAVSTGSSVPRTAADDSGTALALVADGTAPTTGSTHGQWVVNAANTADLAVTGDTATASRGGSATLTATVTNNGPASIDLFTNDDQPSLLVDIPKGTTATAVPKACGPWSGGGKGEPALGAPQYICDLDRPFDAGHSEKLSFTVKVDADAPATTSGDVTTQLAYGGRLPYDLPTSDSTGHFTVHVPDGSTGGGTSGGSGTAGAGGTPTATPAAAQATGTAGGSTSGGTATTGTLASTGDRGTTLLAWIGGALLAFGGAAFALARVRRTRVARG
jgi:LPXTG-motif cell wall-anchored protein